MELVNRKKLIAQYSANPESKGFMELIQDDYVVEALRKAEVVDAVEVVHGRWIRKPIGNYPGADEVCCSVCGAFIAVVNSNTGFEEAKRDMYYCNYCGAKMDLEDK